MEGWVEFTDRYNHLFTTHWGNIQAIIQDGPGCNIFLHGNSVPFSVKQPYEECRLRLMNARTHELQSDNVVLLDRNKPESE